MCRECRIQTFVDAEDEFPDDDFDGEEDDLIESGMLCEHGCYDGQCLFEGCSGGEARGPEELYDGNEDEDEDEE